MTSLLWHSIVSTFSVLKEGARSSFGCWIVCALLSSCKSRRLVYCLRESWGKCFTKSKKDSFSIGGCLVCHRYLVSFLMVNLKWSVVFLAQEIALIHIYSEFKANTVQFMTVYNIEYWLYSVESRCPVCMYVCMYVKRVFWIHHSFTSQLSYVKRYVKNLLFTLFNLLVTLLRNDSPRSHHCSLVINAHHLLPLASPTAP